MKNKTISIILLSLLVVSVGFNIYQFNRSNSLNESVATLQSELNSIKSDMDSLSNTASEKDTEIADLSATITELNATIDSVSNTHLRAQATRHALV